MMVLISMTLQVAPCTLAPPPSSQGSAAPTSLLHQRWEDPETRTLLTMMHRIGFGLVSSTNPLASGSEAGNPHLGFYQEMDNLDMLCDWQLFVAAKLDADVPGTWKSRGSWSRPSFHACSAPTSLRQITTNINLSLFRLQSPEIWFYHISISFNFFQFEDFPNFSKWRKLL